MFIPLGLWGRSMGAITAIMHADRDPTIACMVLDSPFTSLKKVAEELTKSKTYIPGFLTTFGLMFIRNSIKSRAHFNIDDLNPINHVNKSFIPAFFIHGKDDKFILPHHSKDLFDKYPSDEFDKDYKQYKLVEGNHNSTRP